MALITGASRGVGRGVALTLAREGALVAVNYLSHATEADDLAEHIQSRGGGAVAIQAGVFSENECKRLVEGIVSALGPVDVCVVSPGSGWHPELVDQLDAAAALEDVRCEVAPLYNLLPLVLPGMYEREWGRIVGITVHPTELPPAYAYGAAKAARAGALRLASGQVWKHGVTVNAIAPGPLKAIADLGEAIAQCDHGPEWTSRESASPQDVAETVAFLCSAEGRFITGCEVTYLYA